MYSIFFSKIDFGMDLVVDKLKKLIKPNFKVAIFPWAFPNEISNEEFINDYFPINGRRYNKYMNELNKIGILKDNVIICNPYNQTKEELKNIIKTSDVLLLPGGNPEMFFKKVLHDTELIYDFKNFKGIVIGESAGSELQLKRYFITSTNNYYKYFAFYDGFGLIDNDFYLDVHTQDNIDYIKELQEWSNKTNKTIYGICDNGAIIYNRKSNTLNIFGDIKTIEPK